MAIEQGHVVYGSSCGRFALLWQYFEGYQFEYWSRLRVAYRAYSIAVTPYLLQLIVIVVPWYCSLRPVFSLLWNDSSQLQYFETCYTNQLRFSLIISWLHMLWATGIEGESSTTVLGKGKNIYRHHLKSTAWWLLIRGLWYQPITSTRFSLARSWVRVPFNRVPRRYRRQWTENITCHISGCYEKRQNRWWENASKSEGAKKTMDAFMRLVRVLRDIVIEQERLSH